MTRPDIILVMCPPFDVDMPPLGIAYLCSYLKSKGFSPYVFDINVNLFNKVNREHKHLWHMANWRLWTATSSRKRPPVYFGKYIDHYVEEILETGAKVIGLSVHFFNSAFSLEVAKRIKKKRPDRVVILGGPNCAIAGQKCELPLFGWFTDGFRIDPDTIDIFVIGEGEITLTEIMTKLKQGKPLQDIPGIIIHKSNGGANYKPRQPFKPLDILPHPTFKEFDLDKYKTPMLPILGSRGCINHCAFCNEPCLAGKYRRRSAENVFNEIKYHHFKNKTKTFCFWDLLLNGDLKELSLLCDFLISADFKIEWGGIMCVRKEMTGEIFTKIKLAGCGSLVFGVESGSNSVLKKMGKSHNRDDVNRNLRFARESGIWTGINLVVGFPGETEQDTEETIRFIKENRHNINAVSYLQSCIITPCSELDSNPARFGILRSSKNDHWLKWKSGDLNHSIRTKRVEKLIKAVQKMELNVEWPNIYDNV